MRRSKTKTKTKKEHSQRSMLALALCAAGIATATACDHSYEDLRELDDEDREESGCDVEETTAFIKQAELRHGMVDDEIVEHKVVFDSIPEHLVLHSPIDPTAWDTTFFGIGNTSLFFMNEGRNTLFRFDTEGGKAYEYNETFTFDTEAAELMERLIGSGFALSADKSENHLHLWLVDEDTDTLYDLRAAPNDNRFKIWHPGSYKIPGAVDWRSWGVEDHEYVTSHPDGDGTVNKHQAFLYARSASDSGKVHRWPLPLVSSWMDPCGFQDGDVSDCVIERDTSFEGHLSAEIGDDQNVDVAVGHDGTAHHQVLWLDRVIDPGVSPE